MNETKFTPGPWRMIADDTGGQFAGWPSVVATPERDLAIVHRAGFKQEYWEGEGLRVSLANAKLIAAAPDLYAALAEMCRQFTYGNPDQRAAISAGLAALDKARGEEP